MRSYYLLTTHQVGVGYAARSFATIDAQGGFSMLVQQHSEVLVEVEVDILTHGLPAYLRTCLITRFSLSYSFTQLAVTQSYSVTHVSPLTNPPAHYSLRLIRKTYSSRRSRLLPPPPQQQQQPQPPLEPGRE